MDIQDLRAFLAVADNGSFSRAADVLALTQPAVSKRIARLEDGLDTALFDRIGRRAHLTAAGVRLQQHARAIVAALAEAERSVRELSDEVGGDLQIATSHHVGLHHLPPVLRHFSDRYPDVRLNIDFTDSEIAHDLVARGEVELAVITLALNETASIRSTVLWPDPLAFVVAPDHPLATAQTVALAELSAYASVLPGLGTYTGQIVANLFRDASLKLDSTMATNYLETIRMLVSVGLGWSVLPSSMIGEQLVSLNVPGVSLARDLGYIVHRSHTLSNAARAFIECLEAQG